jgi:outer membrane protein assembly complex protein YaeT
MTSDRQPPVRRWRRWRFLAGALVAACVLVVVALHAPFVRARVLAWAVGQLATYGIRLQASRLDYNLLTLSASLDRVTLTAEGATQPFFTAASAGADVSWSAFLGALHVQSIAVDRPTITLIRNAEGMLNLPRLPSERDGASVAAPPPIDRLRIGDLAVKYDDARTELAVDARGLTLDMSQTADRPLAGRLTMAGPASIRQGTHATTVNRLEAGLSFDGVRLALEELAVGASEGRAELSGTIDLLADDQRIDLRARGDVDVERLEYWADLDEGLSGRVAFTGTALGSLNTPQVTLRVSSSGLEWPALGTLSLDGGAALSATTVTLDSLRVGLGAGELIATGRVQFSNSDAGTSEANLHWSNLDAGKLVGLVPGVAVPIAAVSDGSLGLVWTGRDVAGGHGRMSMTVGVAPTAGTALPLSGQIEVSLADRQWTLASDQQIGGEISLSARSRGRLSDEFAASTLGGRVTLDAADLGAAVRRLEAAGFVPVNAIPAGVRGSAAIVAHLDGTFGAPRAAGTIETAGLRVGDTGPASGSLRFTATSREIAVSTLRLEAGANLITASAAVNLSARTLDGQIAGELPELALLSSALPAAWRPDGSAHLAGTFGGTFDKPTADVTVTSDELRVAGQAVRALRTNVVLADGVATVRTFELLQEEGRLAATGHYELDARHYAFSVAGHDLVLAGLELAGTGDQVDRRADKAGAGHDPADAPASRSLSARVNLEFAGTGTVDAPQAAGVIEFDQLDYGEYGIGTASAKVAMAGGSINIEATVPSVGGRADATIDLDRGTVSARAMLVDADLEAVARPSGPGRLQVAGTSSEAGRLPVSGLVSLEATASGPLKDPAALSVVAELTHVKATVGGVPVYLDRPARVRRESGLIVAEDLALHVGGSTLTAQGRLGTSAERDALRASLVGSAADFVPLARLATGAAAIDASGAIDVQVEASGQLDAPNITGRLALSNASLTAADVPPIHDVSVTATYADGLLQVTDVSGAWQGAELSGTARFPLAAAGSAVPQTYVASLPAASGSARATIRLTSLTPAALAPFLDAETIDQLAGRIDLTATFEADRPDVAAVRGEITLERAEVELARVPLQQVQPTRLGLANGRLDVLEWQWAGAGNRIDLAGSVRLTGDAPELNLGLAGTLDLRMLGAFAQGVSVAGQASIDVRAAGIVTDPAIDGRIQVADADIVMRDPRIAVTGLDGSATLAANRIELDRTTANVNGGDLEATGSIEYSGARLTGGALTLTGRGLAIEPIEGLRTEVNADVTLAAGGAQPALVGSVRILRGDYRRTLRLTEQLFAARAARLVSVEPQPPGPLDEIRLNISIDTADDIIVDNNYGRLDLATNLAVIGTAAAPALAGRLTIREGGRVFLGGQTYSVRRGTVDFVNPTRIEPTIDLALETRVQSNDITLELSGTPDTLDVAVRSPGNSQEDAVSLLLTGQPAGDAAIVHSEIARGQLLMLLSGELVGLAGRAVGLDAVQVSRGLGGAASTFDLLVTESDPGARLTLTKELRRDVELIVSQSLRESGDITWIATYRPVGRVELRGATDDSNNESYEFRHEVPFGGGSRPAGTALAAGAVRAPRVAAVDIRATPGFPEADIRARLGLAAGDRFDVYRWQQDRDRLLAFFHDRGYLEARVSARRRETGPNAVTLDYDVTRGPRTTLAVEGHPLPSGLIDQMNEAWGQAVFDGFLVEDLRTMTRATLVADGYLQAAVEVTVSESAGDKTILVRIIPGSRFDNRRLAFDGNVEVSSAAISSAVRARGLDNAGWLDPEALATAVEEYYRSLGYFSADATVEPPAFNAGAATLPVRIAEGPRFRIGAIDVEGVRARSADDVRRILGLKLGAVYEPAAVEPARRRVEVEYLDEGFNQVRVSVAARVDREQAQVNLTLAVVEGPQQVLAAVAVDGAGVTSRSTIDRAMKLAIGEPVDLGEIYGAQKRLYDTGVFQTVDVSIEPVASADDASSNVQPVRARVALQELPPYRFRYGVRAIDESQPVEGTRPVRAGFVVDLLNRNVFGRAMTAGVAGQVEADRWLGRGIVSLPSLFGRPIVTNLFLTRSRQEFTPEGETPFGQQASEVTVEQRFRPASEMAVTYGYSFSRNHVYELNPDPDAFLPPIDIRTAVARLTATYAWDTRDDPSNASRGWFHSSGFEYGPESLGSDLRFVRYLAQQYSFRRVGERVVFASAFRLGAGRGFGQDLIPSERFYAGGATSVRGFAEQGLGPADFFGDPVGGNGLVVLNQEARIRLHRWVKAVGFLDAGNVFSRVRDISFTDLQAGTGVGVRVVSPFAVLRFDLGIPLTSRPTQPASRWYFGIGQTF